VELWGSCGEAGWIGLEFVGSGIRQAGCGLGVVGGGLEKLCGSAMQLADGWKAVGYAESSRMWR
jgi:hypothetical protein